MIVQFITAFALAALVMVCAWALFKTLKRPMPKYLFPMLASVTAIGYGVYSEYTWASRTLAQMPASVEVVHRHSGKSFFSPWSYLVERTDRMSVLDKASIRTHPEHPNFAMVDLLLMQRFNPVVRARQLVDCERSRRADLVSDPTFDANGLPIDLQWSDVADEHNLIKVVCT